MAGKTYPLQIIINAVDKFTAPFLGITRALNAQSQGLTRSFRTSLIALKGVSAEADKLTRKVRNMALVGIGAGWLFKSQFIDTADYYERLTMSLQAIEGSGAKAAESMKFLRKMTVDTPYEMQDLAKAFRILKGFGLDPADGTLQSIVDQVAKLGGVGDDVSGIAMQIGQAWGKQRLLAQDANIMIERGVPVWKLLQDAAARAGKKIPIKELQKMGQNGQLGPKSIIALIQQMGFESKGASDRMMKTWSGMVSNLRDNWTFFTNDVMQAGPLQFLKAQIQSILDTINRMQKDGTWNSYVKQTADTIVQVLTELIAFAKDLWSVLKVVASGLLWIKNLTGSWKPIIITLAAAIAGPLIASLYSLAAAFVSLSVAMAPIIGVVAAVVILGVALGKLANLAIDKFGAIKKACSEMVDFVSKSLGGVGNLLSLIFGGAGGIAKVGGSLAYNYLAQPSGAPAIAPPAASSNQVSTNNAAVTVKFENTPKGTKVRSDREASGGLLLDVGYAMGGY